VKIDEHTCRRLHATIQQRQLRQIIIALQRCGA
jgi:hypothetical protein